jgi:hypothetical protein|tara:strand:- start:70 stop:510 length:441 start_codon:yes stop_codon:yes gene_type:complete
MSDVLTGARARFSISGVKVGYATGVSVREMLTMEPLKVLDEIQVKEHVPIDYEVSMTADMVRLVGTTLKSLGWFPKQGATPKDHLDNILALGELTAHLEDNQGGGVIKVIEGVKISEQNITVTARGVVGVNATMVAKRARDESDLT